MKRTQIGLSINSYLFAQYPRYIELKLKRQMFRYGNVILDLGIHTYQRENKLRGIDVYQNTSQGFYTNFGLSRILPIDMNHIINIGFGALYNDFNNNDILISSSTTKLYGYNEKSLMFHFTPEVSYKISRRFCIDFGFRLPLYTLRNRTYLDKESRSYGYSDRRYYPVNFSYANIQLSINYYFLKRWVKRRNFSL